MANKALLVGINKYKIPGSDLSGCVNRVKASLRFNGFSQIPQLKAVKAEKSKRLLE